MKLRNITPSEYNCVIAACPTIYEVTPKEMSCVIGSCPTVYEDRESEPSYYIVGEKINPEEVDLTDRVGETEALIRVPKGMIDKMRK